MKPSPLPRWRAALADPRRWRRWAVEAAILVALVAAVSLWQNRDLPEGAAPPLSGVRSDGAVVKVGAGGKPGADLPRKVGAGGMESVPPGADLPPKVGAGGTAPGTETAQLVVFWATWCPVCRAEEGNIETIAGFWPVVSVATQSGDAATVAKYLQSRGLALPALIDDDGEQAANWRVRATPTHFVLDREGNIRFRVVGYATTLGLAARLWWAERFSA